MVTTEPRCRSGSRVDLSGYGGQTCGPAHLDDPVVVTRTSEGLQPRLAPGQLARACAAHPRRTLGLAKNGAIGHAGTTASRAVLFNGTTFVVALSGMLIVPTTLMRSLAAGAIIVGVVSVVAALTLLPALLRLFGDRVDALRVPVLGRNLGRTDAIEGRFWRRVVDSVLRRPVPASRSASAHCWPPPCPNTRSVWGTRAGARGIPASRACCRGAC
jgi:hypothetical protein